MKEGLHAIDFVIIGVYALGMLAIGGWYSRRTVSRDEYFTGGRGMNPFLVGISLFATMLSTISYLSKPGEIVKHGPYTLTAVATVPISFFIVGYWLIPALMKFRLTSAYELLETRLGLSSRLIGAGMFVSLRLMWMAVLLNFAASAMLVMMGLDRAWLFPATAMIGAVALAYSTLGGLRAVVVTDLIQFILLLGGALLVVGVVTHRMGGFGWFPTEWDPDWTRQPVFTLDPWTRLSVVGVLVSQTLWTLCTAGGDQTAVQRYMATTDAAAARKSYLVKSGATILVSVTLALVGLALMAYYRQFPESFADGQPVVGAADQLFPYFIAHQLPMGVSGFVVAGMFAAAMSSVDSGVNSVTAVVSTDFIERFRKTPADDKAGVVEARLITVAVGVLVILCTTLIDKLPGNFFEVSKRATELFVAPLFTLFFVALFIPRATAAGANLGALSGFLAAATIAFWNPLFDTERAVTFTWINPIALLVGIPVGWLVSRLTYPHPPSHEPTR
jgi:SSS family solute:Na+ symporter